jgi:S-adenosylmethionine/arginine decarboxylase-like enzyme
MYSLKEEALKTQTEMVVKPLHNLGDHLILEFMNVEVDLNDYEVLDHKLNEFFSQISITVEGQLHKKIEPAGVKIIYLFSEGHMSINTWPELKACALDIYLSGKNSFADL